MALTDDPTPNGETPEAGYTLTIIPTAGGDCRIATSVSPATIADWYKRYETNPQSLTSAQTLYLMSLVPVMNAIADGLENTKNSGGMLA